jgi:hypothetical protein
MPNYSDPIILQLNSTGDSFPLTIDPLYLYNLSITINAKQVDCTVAFYDQRGIKIASPIFDHSVKITAKNVAYQKVTFSDPSPVYTITAVITQIAFTSEQEKACFLPSLDVEPFQKTVLSTDLGLVGQTSFANQRVVTNGQVTNLISFSGSGRATMIHLRQESVFQNQYWWQISVDGEEILGILGMAGGNHGGMDIISLYGMFAGLGSTFTLSGNASAVFGNIAFSYNTTAGYFDMFIMFPFEVAFDSSFVLAVFNESGSDQIVQYGVLIEE